MASSPFAPHTEFGPLWNQMRSVRALCFGGMAVGLLVFVPFAVCLGATPAYAQNPADTLTLRVLDADRDEPLSAVQVIVDGRVRGLTDETGRAALAPAPGRSARLRLQRVGFRTVTVAAVPDSATAVLSVRMQAAPVALPGIRAGAGPEGNVRTPVLKEFYRRTRVGIGRYFTRTDIDRARPRSVSDLFRGIPGLLLVPTLSDDKPLFMGDTPRPGLASSGPQANKCEIQYFLDGTPFYPHNGVLGNEIRPQELEGIEIYRNGSGAPARYRRAGQNCGVVLLWKRERH